MVLLPFAGAGKFQWGTGRRPGTEKFPHKYPIASKWGAEVEQNDDCSNEREDFTGGAWAHTADGEEGTIRPCPKEVVNICKQHDAHQNIAYRALAI